MHFSLQKAIFIILSFVLKLANVTSVHYNASKLTYSYCKVRRAINKVKIKILLKQSIFDELASYHHSMLFNKGTPAIPSLLCVYRTCFIINLSACSFIERLSLSLMHQFGYM